MTEAEKYRQWPEIRGIEHPSEADVERFARQVRASPYGTLLELLLAAWLDSRGMFGGTRGWLRGRGLWEPSADDLRNWSRSIRRAVIWRSSAVLAVELAWFSFLALAGVWGVLFSVLGSVSTLLCGLNVSAGTKLMGNDRLALHKAG